MKTLVVQTAFLGDLLLTLPLVRAIKHNDPDGEIQILIRAGYREVLQSNPDISHVIELDKLNTGNGISTTGVIGELRNRKFDKAIIPHRTFRSALIPYLAGIPERIGFFSAPGYVLYSESLEYLPTGHQILRMLILAGERGADVELFPLTIYPSEDNFVRADELISGIDVGKAENVAAIAPGSNWATKRWTMPNYAELAERLIVDYGYHVIFTGADEDKDICFEISKQLPSSGWAITAGDFSIMETAALFARSSFVIANDSAAGHLASGVSTPVLTLYGPTVPVFGFYPIGKENVICERNNLYCRPCSNHGPMKCPEHHFKCMNELTVDHILRKMEPLLDRA
ncbi:MAG: lipopolysaccharide heptosyltransferase II [candidate division Zixibacteria bacterium]|nr:lipopolysaccharide heptosyltransferase II [candidate division Zixibacteria bacterium]